MFKNRNSHKHTGSLCSSRQAPEQNPDEGVETQSRPQGLEGASEDIRYGPGLRSESGGTCTRTLLHVSQRQQPVPTFPKKLASLDSSGGAPSRVKPSDLPVGGTESVLTDSRSVFTTSPSSRYAATRNLVTLPRGRLSSRIPTSAAVPHPFTDPSPCPALRSPLGQIRRANIASEKRHQTKRPRPPSSPTRIHQEADMWDGVKPRKPLLPAGQVVGVPRRRNTEANASEARDEENGGGQLQPRCHRAPHPERRYPRDMLGLELNSPRHQ